MKNIILVLVLLVSGISFSQDKEVSLYEFNIELMEFLNKYGIDDYVPPIHRVAANDPSQTPYYPEDKIKVIKKAYKKFLKGNYDGLKSIPDTITVMTAQEYFNERGRHNIEMLLEGTLTSDGINTENECRTGILGVQTININKNGILSIEIIEYVAHQKKYNNSLIRTEIVVETINGDFKLVHLFNCENESFLNDL